MAHDLTSAQNTLERINTDKQKQLKSVEKKHNDAKADNVKLHAKRVAEINSETKISEQEADAELQKLKKQELDELKGRGADTELVEDCKTKISKADDELKYIEQNRKLVYDYKRDKEELFDQEDNLKSQKKSLAERIIQLNEKYDQRKQNTNNRLRLLERNLASAEKRRNVLKMSCRRLNALLMMSIFVLLCLQKLKRRIRCLLLGKPLTSLRVSLCRVSRSIINSSRASMCSSLISQQKIHFVSVPN